MHRIAGSSTGVLEGRDRRSSGRADTPQGVDRSEPDPLVLGLDLLDQERHAIVDGADLGQCQRRDQANLSIFVSRLLEQLGNRIGG